MLLRELDAFAACWLDLRDQYPTSREDNTLIAHAMGQIVDLVEKPDHVEQALPDHLKILFRRLALAYFQGYIPQSTPLPVRLPVAVDSPSPPPTAPSGSVQTRDISAAVEHVRRLAHQAQSRLQQSTISRHCLDPDGCSIEEMETLIVDFPDRGCDG